MPNGYTGKILRVNLSDASIKVEEPGDDFYRTYLGGRVLAGYLPREGDSARDRPARPREQAPLRDRPADRPRRRRRRPQQRRREVAR